MLSHWTKACQFHWAGWTVSPRHPAIIISPSLRLQVHTHIVSRGFWGLELRLSGLYNNNFTPWAFSSALFAVMILFPKVTNHISTTWAISRRWIKSCNVILLPHVGELENRKGIAFAQGHATSGIKTFFVPKLVYWPNCLWSTFSLSWAISQALPDTRTKDLRP